MAKFGKILRKVNKKFGQVGKTLSKIGQLGLTTGALLTVAGLPELGAPLAAIGGIGVGVGEVGKQIENL